MAKQNKKNVNFVFDHDHFLIKPYSPWLTNLTLDPGKSHAFSLAHANPKFR